MGAAHSSEPCDGGAGASGPPADRHQRHHKRRRHSVDSVASYSSQNHVDRIRTQNFTASSCPDDADLPSLKRGNFKRSISNLDISFSRRPDSASSNGSSTRSRLREFVDRKSQDDRGSVNTTGDIEYFENPTETLEFDRQRSTQGSKKCHDEHKKKKRSKEEKAREAKPKKHEKYQSKLAEYYNLPAKSPQDDFYQHLTRSKATSEELLQRRFASNCSDAEFNGSYGKLCKHKETEGSNLRRSRSLAVIREETYTDLQIQNHSKSKRSQLIPRARLFDKPCFKDRLPGRAKYQTKEEALESIYIKSTTSCFGDINDHLEPKVNTTSLSQDDKSNADDSYSHRESHHSKSIEGSWPNLAENISKLYPNLSEDSINYSRNPSEIDSLDSNYVRKHYNFEAHQNGNYKESSPETDRSQSPTEGSKKKIFIRPDVTENDDCGETIETTSPHCLSDPNIDRTDIYFSNDSASRCTSEKSQTDFNVLDANDIDSYEEVCLVEPASENTKKINTQTITKYSKAERYDIETRSVASENDGAISTPPDSITSYVSISIPSSTNSTKLEHLTNSLANKIDEYCEYRENQSHVLIEYSNNQPVERKNTLYTKVNQVESLKESSTDQLHCKPKEIYINKEKVCNNGNHVSSIYLDSQDIRSKQLNQNESSSKNITTEPFVTTLIENQYCSLPDVNIGKSLRKSERIDAKLREEDPEDIYFENTYEIAHPNINNISSTHLTENYGQINSNHKKDKSNHGISASEELDIFFTKNIDSCKLKNGGIFEDDIKSIISVSSGNEESDINFEVDTHQNEKEVNEIEGTIRANKLITKNDPNENERSGLKPTFIVGGNDEQSSCCSLTKSSDQTRNKPLLKHTGVKKHYSLRQREPNNEQANSLPNPENLCELPIKEINLNSDFGAKKTNSLLSRVKSFKSSTESSIELVPLSGHQTIVIDPPISQYQTEYSSSLVGVVPKDKHTECPNEYINKDDNTLNKTTKQELGGPCQLDTSRHFTTKEAFITIKLNKVVKATIPKLKQQTSDTIADVPYKPNKPPEKLIINKNQTKELSKSLSNMSRPQVLQIVDSKNLKEKIDISKMISDVPVNRNDNDVKSKHDYKREDCNDAKDIQNYNNVSDKINNAIKTDIEYQEKLHSVKKYWSKLIDKTNDATQDLKMKDYEKSEDSSKEFTNLNVELSATTEAKVSDIVKSIETVKIVDSIRKPNQAKLEMLKDETEKIKDNSEIEETTVKHMIKQAEHNVSKDENKCPRPKSCSQTLNRETPDIEIVELSSDDNKNSVTQATLIKAKSYENGCEEFDHVRYRVMKSELFQKSMIANYRKEAQFDGLLQYLQDYSFQELLVNNNVVIIEPVRTKVEPMSQKISTSRISPSLLKNNDKGSNIMEKSKNAIKRHFFYHPIRVNKEIIEEELPNPDTVKKVRNLFEDTLKMKSPIDQSDPAIMEEPINISQRSASYRNIMAEPKVNRNVCRKKTIRNLTLDTSFGNKKWDSASLSSGVSSGDLSSNNEYETDGMSPYSNKHIRDNVYSSSSEEYLCDSLNPNICYESQYVSQDILKKIRECGTSITYYGGKVLNSKTGPAMSPMTKAIMEEIRGLQKNCSRDCYSCQTKCHGNTCACLVADTHKITQDDGKLYSCTSSDSGNQDPHRTRESKRTNSFPGFKFKLVKSNSCSSRLELTGTDDIKNPRLRFRNKLRNSIEDPPIIYDGENSVKNKVCRLESYKKGMVDSPFDKNIENNNYSDIASNFQDTEDSHIKLTTSEGQEIGFDTPIVISTSDKAGNVEMVEKHNGTQDEKLRTEDIDKESNDPHRFERKFYYVNDKIEQNKGTSKKKFGEMVFEEFEVLESSYDTLKNAKSASK